jgi:hypothetical protein
VGGAIGVALLGTLAEAGGMHVALGLAAGVFLAGQLVALLVVGRRRRAASGALVY